MASAVRCLSRSPSLSYSLLETAVAAHAPDSSSGSGACPCDVKVDIVEATHKDNNGRQRAAAAAGVALDDDES